MLGRVLKMALSNDVRDSNISSSNDNVDNADNVDNVDNLAVPNDNSLATTSIESNESYRHPHLSTFDVTRKIRRLLPSTDNAKLDISPETIDNLRREITCSICLGILDKTWTVMACVHRFCFECIHKVFRMEKTAILQKECPLCRLKLASRRDSKPDIIFDQLVFMFQPGMRSDNDLSPLDLEAIHRSESASHGTTYESYRSVISGSSIGSGNSSSGRSPRAVSEEQPMIDIAAYRKAHEENVKNIRMRQVEYRLRAPESPVPSFQPTVSAGSRNQKRKLDSSNRESASSPTDHHPHMNQITNRSPMVAFALFPRKLGTLVGNSNEIGLLAMPYLRASSLLEVRDLKLLLEQKNVGFSTASNIEISVMFQSQVLPLPDNCSLKDVCVNFWDRNSKFELFYCEKMTSK